MAKTRSTLIMDADLWKRFKMIAILNEMEVSELVEQALREKLERMKQLEQYPEYKDVRNLRVHKGEQQQDEPVIHSSRYEKAKSNGPITAQQSQPQSSRQRSEQSHTVGFPIPEGEYEEEANQMMEEDRTHYTVSIPGLKFPIDKKGLVQIMREFQNEFNKKYRRIPLGVEHTLFLIEKLDPNKAYKSFSRLQDDLDKLVNDQKIAEKLTGIPERIIGCTVARAPPIPEWNDEMMEKYIKYGDEDRKFYQERKKQYEKSMKIAT